MRGKEKLPLIWKISMGFIIGIALGFIIGPMASTSAFTANILLPGLDLIGKIFLSLLKMLIVPLVFSSIIMGAASIGDPKVLGRIGVKTVALYLSTTVVAIVFGLFLGNIIQPGLGLDITGASGDVKSGATIVETILNIFPSNPLMALVNGVMLQVALPWRQCYPHWRKRQEVPGIQRITS